MSTIYMDRTYADNNPEWHVGDAAWKAGKIRETLARNGVAPATVLDVGCGVGEIVVLLSNDMPATEFVGHEISPFAFERARVRSGGRVRFATGDLFEGATAYDLAMAIDVFEHVDDYMGFLRRMKGCATFKLYHIPLDLSVQSVLRGSPLLRERRDVGHLHYFTKETALACLRDTGHEIVDHRYTSIVVDRGGDGLKARLAWLPRALAPKLLGDFGVRLLGGYSLMVLCR